MKITVPLEDFSCIVSNIQEMLEDAYPDGYSLEDFSFDLGLDEYAGVTTTAWVVYNHIDGKTFVAGITSTGGKV